MYKYKFRAPTPTTQIRIKAQEPVKPSIHWTAKPTRSDAPICSSEPSPRLLVLWIPQRFRAQDLGRLGPQEGLGSSHQSPYTGS